MSIRVPLTGTCALNERPRTGVPEGHIPTRAVSLGHWRMVITIVSAARPAVGVGGMTTRARGVAVAVALGGIALGAVFAPAATAAPARSGQADWASAGSAAIRPGVVTDT